MKYFVFLAVLKFYFHSFIMLLGKWFVLQILKRPQNIVSPDFLLQRSVDQETLSENETLVSEWIKNIDQVLMEAIDER